MAFVLYLYNLFLFPSNLPNLCRNMIFCKIFIITSITQPFLVRKNIDVLTDEVLKLLTEYRPIQLVHDSTIGSEYQ